jgi:hypothetical protein
MSGVEDGNVAIDKILPVSSISPGKLFMALILVGKSSLENYLTNRDLIGEGGVQKWRQ